MSSFLDALRQFWQVNEVLGLSAAFFLWLKGCTTAIMITIFSIHKSRSLDPEFIQRYPNLIASCSKKTYLKFQAFFTLVPFADYYFFYRCIKYRFSTVAFLKDYAVPRKLFEPSAVALSQLTARRRRRALRRKVANELYQAHQQRLAEEHRKKTARKAYHIRRACLRTAQAQRPHPSPTLPSVISHEHKKTP